MCVCCMPATSCLSLIVFNTKSFTTGKLSTVIVLNPQSLALVYLILSSPAWQNKFTLSLKTLNLHFQPPFCLNYLYTFTAQFHHSFILNSISSSNVFQSTTTSPITVTTPPGICTCTCSVMDCNCCAIQTQHVTLHPQSFLRLLHLVLCILCHQSLCICHLNCQPI